MEFPIVINWTSPLPLLGLLVVFFIFIQILIERSVSKLGLHCLHIISHKKEPQAYMG